MRDAFIKSLGGLAKKNKNLFLLNGDLGFSILEPFYERFPGRSINMGVAEANMLGTAAGLALEGNIVFVYSIVPFVTMRAFEQVRNDIAMQKANVKIVGVGAGLTYGPLGPTHHSVTDISLMRSLPSMTVFSPGDPIEAAFATEEAARIKGPVYLRIGKRGDPIIHSKNINLISGKGVVIENGRDITLIATGSMLEKAVKVSNVLRKKRISCRVISIHTIKPLDKRIVIESAKKTNAIFTLEEHSIIGGLGSAVSEILMESEFKAKIFFRFGINDKFTEKAGSQEFLRTLHGLTEQKISSKIKSLLKK